MPERVARTTHVTFGPPYAHPHLLAWARTRGLWRRLPRRVRRWITGPPRLTRHPR